MGNSHSGYVFSDPGSVSSKDIKNVTMDKIKKETKADSKYAPTVIRDTK